MVENFEIDRVGTIRYFRDGLLHREDGPAVKYSDDDQEWWSNGIRHRIDGPALSYKKHGIYQWYIKGLLHNEDGPAIIHSPGFKSYYLNNKRISEREFIKWKLLSFLK